MRDEKRHLSLFRQKGSKKFNLNINQLEIFRRFGMKNAVKW